VPELWTLTTRKTIAQGLTRMARIFGARLCAQHQSQLPGWREDIQIFPCQPVVGRAAAGLSDIAALHFRLWLRHAALRRVNPRLKNSRMLGSGLKAVCSISLVANEQRQFPSSAGKNG
jgi:hypothetical protein